VDVTSSDPDAVAMATLSVCCSSEEPDVVAVVLSLLLGAPPGGVGWTSPHGVFSLSEPVITY